MAIENFNKKLNKVLSKKKSGFLEKATFQLENQAWLEVSSDIAFNILEVLDDKGWTQKQLAEKLEVSPQQVSKIVKGKENLRLSTITRLEEVLETELFFVVGSERDVERSAQKELEAVKRFIGDVSFTITESLQKVEEHTQFVLPADEEGPKSESSNEFPNLATAA